MTLKTRDALEFKDASGLNAAIRFDRANSRLSMYLGSTEVLRMTATAFTPMVDQSIGGGDLDLGSSGVAGSLDIFPTTAAKGKLRFDAIANTNDDAVTVRNAAHGQASVYSIPDSGAATANFVMSEGAATINGIKTFGSMFRIPRNAPVAGAGTVQGDAAALSEGFTTITGANGTVGWRLPTAVAGAIVIIKGTTAGVAKIWPATGAQINAVGTNTAMSLASGAIPAFFIADSTTQWYTIPLLPS